ncbi:Glycoside hydrolase [Mycena venus]|uniref:Glycoside hydrolase n=1 Tax=Mycena venus TaxID=2733690 RepID=A0A8H7CIW9_9AGAR|nr:Glycoside hydrolase [Mycena venus]
MKPRFSTLVCAVLWCARATLAADCKFATVVSGSNCFSIAQAASITTDQLSSFNPGLDCSALAIGQKLCISSGTLPGQPQKNPDGSCATYTTVPNDSCSAIGVKFSITVANIELWNANTFHWKGCAGLQVNYTMCVSSGTPPPPPIIAGLQCGPQSQGNNTCPLNACCSAFGFCGLTDEFCTTTGANPCISNCGVTTLPSCGSSGSMRKIGYYAGWGNRRACGTNVAPNQINWSGFTGAHFAFATISQGLQIQLADADTPLLQQLVGQKANFPELKVIIAVGGWDFSELDPTRDLFSVMISSPSNRATFISSVKSFLTQFGVDGIDIDFEYPSAIERAAPATDTPNLTSFFQELRTALPTQIISCATPAGYWFLKGFEIDKIAKSVTYLNMMSYDYHGPWDTNVTDQAPVTNPHTSILDMHDSASLYVRAGINLNIVNLGMAYYGRTFQVASSSCVGYNCTMTGGGSPGSCTSTPGILAQLEIESLLDTGIVPTLDKSTQTYWFDKSGSLITFDQQDTWAAKTTFAQTTCFGGTFIWSLDQVTSNPGDGGGSLGSSSGAGSGQGSGTFTSVEWNPNPFPSPNAASETFIQVPGVVTSTVTSVVSQSTVTTSKTLLVPAATSVTTTLTALSGSIQTITRTVTIPATTSTLTVTITQGSTVTSITTVSKTATTVVVPVPKTTTTVIVEGATITLNSGGTPVNSPVPTGISQPSAITPTFTQNVSPTKNATVIVYTAPLTSPVTWSSTITIPPKSTSPPVVVTGPPGDKSRCGGTLNIWSVLFGGIISGCPPADVGIIGGITPPSIPPSRVDGQLV